MLRKTIFRHGLLALGFALFVYPAAGQDRIFTYTYQSLVLSPDQREIEVWNTIRWGHQEYFRGFNHRLEFETGITRGLQTAFYLNIQEGSAMVVEPGLAVTGQGQVVPVERKALMKESELSFSNEWKFKVLDPAADPMGLALYGEYLVRSDGLELEPRIILDKYLGRTILAFNASGEFEFEQDVDDEGNEVTDRTTSLELAFGGSYNLANGLWLGLEAVARTGFEDGIVSFSALFAGPTFSYTHDKFWVNVTFLPQLVGLKGATQDGLVLGELERYETRLLFSYAL